MVAVGSWGAELLDITAGPDGNLWFPLYYAQGAGSTKTGVSIGRMTPATVNPAFSEFSKGITGGGAITAAPDGNLWFIESSANEIGRITPAGVVTGFPAELGEQRTDITAGPDGNLWFTEQPLGINPGNKIGRITAAGVATEFSLGAGDAADGDITAGPDNAVWFISGEGIGRMETTGPKPTPNGHHQSAAAICRHRYKHNHKRLAVCLRKARHHHKHHK